MVGHDAYIHGNGAKIFPLSQFKVTQKVFILTLGFTKFQKYPRYVCLLSHILQNFIHIFSVTFVDGVQWKDPLRRISFSNSNHFVS